MDRIRQLKQYLAESGEDSFLQHALALEYIKAGNEVEAQQLFEKILERDPGYLGSYYHLGKLFERIGEAEKAVGIYRKGMKVAASSNDSHALNELRTACEDLE